MKTEQPLTQLLAGKLPEMVRWYDPRLLFRVGVRTLVSSVFGQYADQRLVQAATDPGNDAQIKARYDYSNLAATNPDHRIKSDANGAYWVDYLSDTGDGFESTYTMAYLAALESLRVNDADGKARLRLTAGDILIMGGDQCYPQATREDYKRKLITPFSWAFDVPVPQRKLFAIPGNHDWYDGLAAFDSLFCSSRDKLSVTKGEKIGGWQCQQHRSYWAMKLPHDWWIWGTDIQFSKYLDNAQVSYFEAMAGQMHEGDKLIICMAEPSWLLSDFGQQDEEENFFKITAIARQAGVRIVAVIAGDWHHYNRYYSHEHDVHFITAGGGGSFLHPTHGLKTEIKVEWPTQVTPARQGGPGFGPPTPAAWTKETVDIRLNRPKNSAKPVVGQVADRVGEVLSDVVEPVEDALRGRRHQPRLKPQEPKCYPERMHSAWLSLGNLFFPFRNIAFSMGIGLIYWLITWEFYSLVTNHDISAGSIDAIGLTSTFWEVFKYTPFYLLQGLLVSLPLAFMLFGLWAALTWYVDAGQRHPVRRVLRKFFVGTGHFLAHVTAMFALGLMFVQWNNWIAPHAQRYADTVWVSTAKNDNSMSGAVAKKILEPLAESRQAMRDKVDANGRVTRDRSQRVPPPTSAVVASETNKLRPTAVRQIVGFVLYPFEMIVLGGLVGGFIWGLYWVLTGLFLRMHAEDAFAALRIKHYKNFLRFKFERDQLTIYPIGVDKVPPKRFWQARSGATGALSHNPQLVASAEIPVRLIERPIIIRADSGVA
jgi:hypothetical protein